jgi:tol-pal system protein YbgF
MNLFGLTARRGRLLAILPGIAVVFALAVVGCGSAEEAMEDEWGTLPEVGSTAQLELRIDSLMNENRKLRDQVEAVTGENRRLTARTAELETRVAEAMAAAQAAPPAASAAPLAPAPVAYASESNSAYEAARALYNGRNYQGALEQFQALLNSGSAGKFADNCQYWIGESYYGLGKYSEAVQAFREVVAQKRSSKLPYAYMMIGNCEALLGNKDAAREAYSRVVADFPTSPVASKAQAKLSRM